MFKISGINQTLEIRSLNDGENQRGGDGELHHPFDDDDDEDLFNLACDDADKDRVFSVPFMFK
jgi:hypothetical protein